MNAECRYGIALKTASGGRHANIRTIQMEMRQMLIEPESGGFSQDQNYFVQSLDGCGMITRLSDDTQAAGVYVSSTAVIEGFPIAPQNSPLRIRSF
jgi:hypothetical protein